MQEQDQATTWPLKSCCTAFICGAMVLLFCQVMESRSADRLGPGGLEGCRGEEKEMRSWGRPALPPCSPIFMEGRAGGGCREEGGREEPGGGEIRFPSGRDLGATVISATGTGTGTGQAG